MVSSEIYHINTRRHVNFHQSSVKQTKYQKGVDYLDVSVLYMLPSYIKIVSDNSNKYKLTLQKFLYKNFFYHLDEYFELI